MYALFTDTDTDIRPIEAEKFGYHLISMPYCIDGKEIYPYQDFTVFDYKTFYGNMRKGVIPKTEGISPAKYKNYFEPFFKNGQDVLYVHFSAAMSGTFNAMEIARQELKEVYPERDIYTVDTKAISIGSLNIVKEIGEMYKDGKSIKEIQDWARIEVGRFATYFFANDLKFFKRTGRVKGIKAFMGDLLGIKPIINMNSDGIMDSIDKAKGIKGAMEKIVYYVSNLQEDIFNHRVMIAHSDNIELAEELATRLKAEFNESLPIEFVVVNPTAGSHCGSESIGVSFHAKHR